MIRRSFGSQALRLALVAVVVSAVDAQVGESRPHMGVPDDWTHHHVLFSLEQLRNHPEIAAREPRALHEMYRRWGRLLRARGPVDGTTKSSGDWNVNVGGSLAPGTSPAKYQTDPTAPPDCINDFVAFALSTPGVTGGQSTLVGFNHLYAGPNGMGGACPGGPNYIFAYNTSTQTNGRVRTSPVLSLDGKKIAFIESSASGSAVHVLKIGTTGNNGTSGIVSVAPGVGNNAVLTTIVYTAANNNHSSPWVDYVSDTLYAAADNGKLSKITGIFKGTPTLVTTGGWPISFTGNVQVSSPVFDATTGRLFIGDSHGVLYSVNAITPGPVSSLGVGKLGQLNPAITDGPIVDGYGSVFATASNDGTSAVVVQANAANLTQTTRVNLGVGSTTGTSVTLYDGGFDNNYFTSQNSGHLLACGTSPAIVGTTAPYRYNMAFIGGVLQPDAAPVQISASTTARCGPITEYFNPTIGASGTDFFFWGVTNNCVGATGCIMSLANGATVTKAAENGGTSGVTIDNDGDPAQQYSNIYFGNEIGPLRVIKVQQSTLQ
jgi:hypothetical protein